MYSKMTKLFDECDKQSYEAGEILHSDVNTMPMESWGGNRYCINFVDDKTGFRYVHYIKTKC